MEKENVDVSRKQTGQAIAVASTSKPSKDSGSDAQTKQKDSDVAQNKAEVWKYFKNQKDKGTAVCNICNVVLKAIGGCTSGLISHAKSKHDINVLKRKVIAG